MLQGCIDCFSDESHGAEAAQAACGSMQSDHHYCLHLFHGGVAAVSRRGDAQCASITRAHGTANGGHRPRLGRQAKGGWPESVCSAMQPNEMLVDLPPICTAADMHMTPQSGPRSHGIDVLALLCRAGTIFVSVSSYRCVGAHSNCDAANRDLA